jgi:hypothetical protein
MGVGRQALCFSPSLETKKRAASTPAFRKLSYKLRQAPLQTSGSLAKGRETIDGSPRLEVRVKPGDGSRDAIPIVSGFGEGMAFVFVHDQRRLDA